MGVDVSEWFNDDDDWIPAWCWCEDCGCRLAFCDAEQAVGGVREDGQPWPVLVCRSCYDRRMSE